MTEEARGIGAALRAAREEKGWTTQDVGSRLRLMSRQIEAIEAEEFSRLGQPVFARGFVRNYARLLGLDADELLEQMSRFKAAPVQEVETVPFTPAGEFWKSPWVLGGIAAVVLLIAIPVGLYLWLNSDEAEPVAAAVEQTVPPPPPPPAPAVEPPAAVPVPMAEPPAAAPIPAQPVAPAPAPVKPLAPEPAPQASAPAVQKPAPAQLPPAPTVRPPLPFPMRAPSAPPPASPPPAAPALPAAPAQPPAAANISALRMQFDEAAWVQVRDSTGRTVHSGLNPAGSAVELNGKAPFYLVVGNASKVRVSYKGKPVDLAPYIDVTVARLTINP